MMKKVILSLSVFAVVLFYACGSDASKSKTDSAGTTAVAAADGASLYKEKCTMCHGDDGKAGVMGAKDLSTSTLDQASATAMVKSGKGMMKAFGGELSDEQIGAVVKYAESLRK